MMVDYVTLMLLAGATGLFLYGLHLFLPGHEPPSKGWAAAFASVGLILLLTSMHMIFTWPLIGSFNIAFGEVSMLFGTFLLGMALVVAFGWSPAPMSVFGFASGLAGILIGARFIHLRLSLTPWLAGVGFILSGIGGITSPFCLTRGHVRAVRWASGAVVIAAALIWAFMACGAYWMHLESFQKWKPQYMQPPPAPSAPSPEKALTSHGLL